MIWLHRNVTVIGISAFTFFRGFLIVDIHMKHTGIERTKCSQSRFFFRRSSTLIDQNSNGGRSRANEVWKRNDVCVQNEYELCIAILWLHVCLPNETIWTFHFSPIFLGPIQASTIWWIAYICILKRFKIFDIRMKHVKLLHFIYATAYFE